LVSDILPRSTRVGRLNMALCEESTMDTATVYANIILSWHVANGDHEWTRRFDDERNDWLPHYRHTIARFMNSDLTDPAVQSAIANEQISGSMEWAYGFSVEEQLPRMESGQQKLGEIARKLRELVSRSEQEAIQSEGGRTVVHFSDRETLLVKARQIYAAVAGAEVQGGGGVSFLLSCSLERSAEYETKTVLLSPEILGISPAPRGRESDLLEQLLSEGMEILDVTGS
jgi:hypothetical protein